MEYSVHPHPTDGGLYLRFPTDLGIIWVKVMKVDEETASLVVMEQDSAMEAAWMNDDETMALPCIQAQRNRFGPALMLGICRTVRAALPKVSTWVYERKSGANVGVRARRGHAAAANLQA